MFSISELHVDEPFTVSDTDLEATGPKSPISVQQQSHDLVLLPPPAADLENEDGLLLVPPPPSNKDFGGPGQGPGSADGGGPPTVKIDIRAPPDLDLRLDGSGDVYAESDSR